MSIQSVFLTLTTFIESFHPCYVIVICQILNKDKYNGRERVSAK